MGQPHNGPMCWSGPIFSSKVEHSLWNCGAAASATDLLLLRRPAEAQGDPRGQAAEEAGHCHGLLIYMAGDHGWKCVTWSELTFGHDHDHDHDHHHDHDHDQSLRAWASVWHWPGLGDLHEAPCEKCWAGFGFPLHDCPRIWQHHLVLLPPSGVLKRGIARRSFTIQKYLSYPTMPLKISGGLWVDFGVAHRSLCCDGGGGGKNIPHCKVSKLFSKQERETIQSLIGVNENCRKRLGLEKTGCLGFVWLTSCLLFCVASVKLQLLVI